MRECNDCFKREGKHRWGRWWLCDECHKKHYEERKSKEDVVDLKIPKESRRGAYGYYRHGTSEIYLLSVGSGIEVTLAHEIIHHVLNVFVDPPTSYDYDNISDCGQIHAKLFAVCDER